MDETQRADTLDWLEQEQRAMSAAGANGEGLTLSAQSCRELANWLVHARALALAGAERIEGQQAPAPQRLSYQTVTLTVPLVEHPDIAARMLLRMLTEYLVRKGFGTAAQIATIMDDEQQILRRGAVTGSPNRADPSAEPF